jgi:cold shock CspA family protein
MNSIVGTVESFDAQRGDGWIVSENAARYYFHCVAIANGSRTIPVGAKVTGTPRVGLLGRDEAVNVYSVGN